MILSLTLALAPLPVPVPAAGPAALSAAHAGAALHALQEEFEAEIAAAGEDVAKLLEMAATWKEAGEDDAARASWRRVLEIDTENRDAHKGLRHHEYDGKWFETYTALSKYRREEEKRMADQGLVRFRDNWVPKEEVRYLKLGWEKGEDGKWVSPVVMAALAEEREMREAGWKLQDLNWVSPDEASMIGSGKFKCGEEWLEGSAADEYHATLDTWWEIDGEYFAVYTTLPRTDDNATAEWARWWADSTYAELVKIFGVKPGDVASITELRGENRTKPAVVVLGSVEQYNAFAAGSQDPPRPPAEQEGFSSLHYAFFADTFTSAPTADTPPAYRGAGTALYAHEDANMSPYGQYAVRHAAAHSYVEAIDPSWDTIGDALSGQGNLSIASFWQEKRIPRWLRYGAASYVERYMLDPNAGDGGDPLWIRTWGMSNLNAKGGVGDLAELFQFGLSLEEIEGSTMMIHRAGAVVAFLLDGGDAEVRTAHEAFKAALRKGEDTTETAAALEALLQTKGDAIAAFCQG